jgi:hypothetical protein
MKESNFALIKYSGEHKPTWDQVVRDSKNGNFLHLRDYLDYHAHRFDEQSIIILKQDKPVAVFPCNRVNGQIVSHGGLTYGGLIYGRKLHTVDVLEMFHHISAYYREMGATKLMYKAVPHLFHNYPAEEDLYALTRMGASLSRRDLSSAIRLNDRIKFSDSRKCTIRKSSKQGVEVREGEFLEEYHNLLTQVVTRFGSEPVHSLQELRLLKDRFPDNIRLFGAFNGGALLAGTIIYDFGHIVHTQYLASSEEGKQIGALDFVLAHLIETVFVDREYFSFGISTEQGGRYLNEGLIFQKEGFGARGVVQDFYGLDLTSAKEEIA